MYVSWVFWQNIFSIHKEDDNLWRITSAQNYQNKGVGMFAAEDANTKNTEYVSHLTGHSLSLSLALSLSGREIG